MVQSSTADTPSSPLQPQRMREALQALPQPPPASVTFLGRWHKQVAQTLTRHYCLDLTHPASPSKHAAPASRSAGSPGGVGRCRPGARGVPAGRRHPGRRASYILGLLPDPPAVTCAKLEQRVALACFVLYKSLPPSPSPVV